MRSVKSGSGGSEKRERSSTPARCSTATIRHQNNQAFSGPMAAPNVAESAQVIFLRSATDDAAGLLRNKLRLLRLYRRFGAP